MHIWTIEKWKKQIPDAFVQRKNSIHIRADQGVNRDLKNACREFAKWLKEEYNFPLPIYIYLKNKNVLKTMDGDIAVGTFFEPASYSITPYIRAAVGDYDELLASLGRDNAVATILMVIAHEMTHYFQWINDITITEIGRERQASRYARLILDEYAQTREHP